MYVLINIIPAISNLPFTPITHTPSPFHKSSFPTFMSFLSYVVTMDLEIPSGT